MATSILKRILTSGITIALIACLSLPVAVQAQQEERYSHQRDGNASPSLQELKQTVTIQKKTPDVIISSTFQRYQVSDATLVVGLDGEQVLYRNMLVPCEAEVTYVTNAGKRTVHRIQIKQIGDQATKHFFYERPE